MEAIQNDIFLEKSFPQRNGFFRSPSKGIFSMRVLFPVESSQEIFCSEKNSQKDFFLFYERPSRAFLCTNYPFSLEELLQVVNIFYRFLMYPPLELSIESHCSTSFDAVFMLKFSDSLLLSSSPLQYHE